MSTLNSLYIKKETLETMLKTLEKKGDKGISITVSIGDKANDYGQNVSAYVEQSKEQREEKKPKFYVGNGKTFWSDGKAQEVFKDKPKESKPAPAESWEDDSALPF